MDQKLAYTIDEAAEQSGYSTRTLQRQIKDGNLIMKYANKKGIIRHIDLVNWLENLPVEAPGTER
ncbi:hypothetical protein ACIGB6_14935 [Paeniglutamicibacter gangotriensis]|uniref:hypothetical protein n=1 Tax=Paeniglutamicibacter gangotriensis TaxID=254787 RepID=UPI0037C7E9E6